MKKNGKAEPTPLRFAALVRVSTEQRAATGESLRTQRAEIEATVKQLGGTVAAWYGGQEHATEGWEKQEIGRLLTDARKKGRPWDAVIVSNADRWVAGQPSQPRRPRGLQSPQGPDSMLGRASTTCSIRSTRCCLRCRRRVPRTRFRCGWPGSPATGIASGPRTPWPERPELTP